ncbi:MAG TPA: hypothetical protein VK196_01035 [Magnetospirillum sp.]|nr:hypothetical protein [Magnetospirillum sp.]
MPLLSEDKPVKQTCSLKEAYLWIARDVFPGQLYEPNDYDRAAQMSALLTFHKENLDRLCMNQLHAKLADGTLGARGRPGRNEIFFDKDNETLTSEEPGEAMEIPLDHIVRAGIAGLRISTNSIVVPYPESPLTREFQYTEVSLSTEKLFTCFPSKHGKELQYINTPSLTDDVQKHSKRGRKTKFADDDLIALAAVILEDKGEIDSADDLIYQIQLAYEHIYNREPPSRTTLQDKVTQPLNKVRRAYHSYLSDIRNDEKV